MGPAARRCSRARHEAISASASRPGRTAGRPARTAARSAGEQPHRAPEALGQPARPGHRDRVGYAEAGDDPGALGGLHAARAMAGQGHVGSRAVSSTFMKVARGRAMVPCTSLGALSGGWPPRAAAEGCLVRRAAGSWDCGARWPLLRGIQQSVRGSCSWACFLEREVRTGRMSLLVDTSRTGRQIDACRQAP